MKTKAFSFLMSVALLLAQSSVALVQAQGSLQNWSAVQAVGVDERLIVKQKDGKTIEGKMIEANDTNLSLTRNGKVVNISRDSISTIQHSRGKAAKGKWAAIGAGIGAGAGTGIGAIKYDPNKDDYQIYIYMGTLIGTGVGAVSGLLFGQTRRNRTMVYDAR